MKYIITEADAEFNEGVQTCIDFVAELEQSAPDELCRTIMHELVAALSHIKRHTIKFEKDDITKPI